MSAAKYIVLITGGNGFADLPVHQTEPANSPSGNGGIGFELAKQLIGDTTKHVIIGSRSVEKGKAALQELQSGNQPGSVEMVPLDVTDNDSITAAARTVESKHGRFALQPSPKLSPFCPHTQAIESMR